jgi:thioredoxin reductase
MGMGYTIGCMQTPCAGNEKVLGKETLTPCDIPKKVVIIGAGPAGLEAARVAALRKHKVIVFDKGDEVGGQNLIAAKAAGRQEIQGVTRWLSSQVNKLDIDLRLNCTATLDMILDENPDAVVVATGSLPKEKPFPGEYQFPQVVNSIQVLTGEVTTGPKVIVIDLNGHHHGTGTAEFLASQGKTVHMLVPSLFPGSALGPLQDLFLTSQRLAQKGVTCTPDIAVLEIQGTLVKGLNVYSNEMIDFEGYDTIVFIAGNIADDTLYFELKGKIEELHRIGDCLAPRLTDSAIADGHRIGRLL